MGSKLAQYCLNAGVELLAKGVSLEKVNMLIDGLRTLSDAEKVQIRSSWASIPVFGSLSAQAHARNLQRQPKAESPSSNLRDLLEEPTVLEPELTEEEAIQAISKEQKRRKELKRSKTINDAYEAVLSEYGADIISISSPLPTVEELREKVSGMPISVLKEELAQITTLLQWHKNYPEHYRQKIERIVKLQFQNPENVKQHVNEFLSAPKFLETCKTVEDTVPFLEEIADVYRERLKALEEKRSTVPSLLKEIEKATQEINKQQRKIVKFLERNVKPGVNPSESVLEGLAELVKDYYKLMEPYTGCKGLLLQLDPAAQHQSPLDLPNLPRKVWNKL